MGGGDLLNKAFTLVELLAVVVILAVIALIATPIVKKSIDNSKNQVLKENISSIEKAAYNYAYQNNIGYDTEYKKLTLDELISKGFLKKDIINPVTNEKMNGCVLYKWNETNNQYEFNYNEICPLFPYQDDSGANKPEMLNNMIPIIYENDTWKYANIEEKWYDYNKKEWANAVVLNSGVTKNVGDIISEDEISLWYVWIPRYKYQLFNVGETGVEEQEIQIKFESGIETTGTVKCEDIDFKANPTSEVSEICTNVMLGNWYTHPAFTFGEQELTGFWVGKFEISGTTDNITIKPNVSSLRGLNISTFFNSIKNISDIYNLNGDSHTIKNMEWGAVAYLSHSKYGINEEIYMNNSNDYYTGRSGGNIGGSTNTVAKQFPTSGDNSTYIYYNYGYYTYDGKIVNYDGSIGDYAADRTLGTKASTTGNIYGVYDMSGGTWEHVMGNMVDTVGNFYTSGAGFTSENIPNLKYYDSYSYSDEKKIYTGGKLGDATKETNGWYSDYAGFANLTNSWFDRGGNYKNGIDAGVVRFNAYTGGSNSTGSTRAVLLANNVS